MLDKDVLTQAVSTATFLSKVMPKQMITVKDCNSVHIFCSEYLATLTGRTLDQLIGQKVWLPLYDDNVYFEKIILEEDQAIINSRESKLLLKINRFTTGLTPYLAMKSPLINPETDQVLGIFFQGLEIGVTSLITQLANTFHLKAETKNVCDLPHLSKREKEVIFFFMANLSSQEITEMLYKIEGKRVTKSTIDSIFNNQLYSKFDVYDRIALYQKLRSLGYDQLIPQELLSSMSIMLNTMRPY